MTANPRETLGANNPPDALDDLIAKGDALLDQAMRAPTAFPDLDTAQRGVALVKMLRIAGQKIEEARKALQRPHKAEVDKIAGRARGPLGALASAEEVVGDAVHAFRIPAGLTEIVSDFGPKAYARSVPGEITIDAKNLPPEFLTANIPAIRAALTAGASIPGVTVAPPTETTVIS